MKKQMLLSAASLFAGVVVLNSTVVAAPAAAVKSHPFTVVVTMSPSAKVKLDKIKEKVRVSAMYSGVPVPSKAKLADDVGEIGLGNEDVYLPSSGGKATFKGNVRIDKWTWVKSPQILINVTSAFKTSQSNLLDCGIFQDSFKVAQSKVIQINCKAL